MLCFPSDVQSLQLMPICLSLSTLLNMVTLTSSTIEEDESRAGFTWESSGLPPTRCGEGFEEAESSLWAGLEAVVQKQTPSRGPWHLEDSRLAVEALPS